MGQVLYECATTTHAVRKAIQRSQATVSALAEQYGINQSSRNRLQSKRSLKNSSKMACAKEC